ncbi:hypothetical protein D3C84_853880 [compost metagenome]
MHHSREVPSMTAGRAALVELMSRYVRGLLDPTISLLEVHKLMYFMQEAGEPLRLKYVEAAYGPYAEKPLTLVPGAVEDANAFLEANAETRARFDRVGELVEGFETPFGLELLATVHWIVEQGDPVSSVEEVVARTYAWNARKKQFTPRQIGIAVDVLAAKGWIEPLALSA